LTQGKQISIFKILHAGKYGRFQIVYGGHQGAGILFIVRTIRIIRAIKIQDKRISLWNPQIKVTPPP